MDINQAYSNLIKLAAQMAMKQNMPDVEQVTYSNNIPKKTWRSLQKMFSKSTQQCNDWAYELRTNADVLKRALLQNAEPVRYMVQRFSEGMHEKDEYFATKESAYENARWGYNETKVTPLFTHPPKDSTEPIFWYDHSEQPIVEGELVDGQQLLIRCSTTKQPWGRYKTPLFQASKDSSVKRDAEQT